MESNNIVIVSPDHKGRLTVRHRRSNVLKFIPYVFIGPAVIYLAVVTLIPAIMAMPISFTNWSALTPEMNFVGLENYKKILTDEYFLDSIKVTLQFFLSVPLIMLTGLLQALLLDNKIKGMNVFRVIFYSPVITSTIAAAVIFEWFFLPSSGLFNTILETLGLRGIGWIYDADTAVMSILIFRVWHISGAAMLIYLAGLQDVPVELMEAAEIDGGNLWQKFWYITLPFLKPANIYLLITQCISAFMVFQETYLFLKHIPLRSATTVVNYIYEKGFKFYEMGYASSMSFILFIIILIITLVQYKALKFDEE
jgi:multiple sugar transport system permease protein